MSLIDIFFVGRNILKVGLRCATFKEENYISSKIIKLLSFRKVYCTSYQMSYDEKQ